MNIKGIVLVKRDNQYDVRLENTTQNIITYVENTTGLELNIGDIVIVTYTDYNDPPIITNVYNKTISGADSYTKTETDTLLDDKVDKEDGKQLSTEDYTTIEKNKLNNINLEDFKAEIKAEIKEEEHHIGSFYWSKFNDDPAVQLNMPGTIWQMIEDRYLKAISDSDTPGPMHGEVGDYFKQIFIDWLHNHTQNPHNHSTKYTSNNVIASGTGLQRPASSGDTTVTINESVTATNQTAGTTNSNTQTVDIRPPAYGLYCWVRIL